MNERLNKEVKTFAVLDFVCAALWAVLLLILLFNLNFLIPSGEGGDAGEALAVVFLAVIFLPVSLVVLLAGHLLSALLRIILGIHWLRNPYKAKTGIFTFETFMNIIGFLVNSFGYLLIVVYSSAIDAEPIEYVGIAAMVILVIGLTLYSFVLGAKHKRFTDKLNRAALLEN